MKHEDCPEFFADPSRLKQILINLLSNAIKFTPQGGITIFATQQENWLRIEVSDTGVGIKQEEYDNIFEAFHQIGDSKIKKSGAGLGLAITKKLITMMGGHIKVESKLGQGSTFTVILPLVMGQSPQSD